MNHFLMAALDFDTYRSELTNYIGISPDVDMAIARKTYPWDTAEVAAFKYFFNFVVSPEVRDSAVKVLFEKYIGSEQEFAEELYINWDEAREMQKAGMTLGGHTHMHRPLSSLSTDELNADLVRCTSLLRKELHPQELWPFCYPYGKSHSYTAETVAVLKRLGYDCAFTTESTANLPGMDVFSISRVDCKKAPLATAVAAGGAQGGM